MRKICKIILIIAAVIILIFIFLYAIPLLKINNVTIVGNSFLTREDILKECGIQLNTTNMLHINYFTLPKRVENYNPYINTLKIYPISYDTIKIEIKENKPRGYVPYMNNYLCINEEGRVLDITKEPTGSLPIVSGLKFDNISRGEILNISNPNVFYILVEISKLMEKYEMEYNDLTVNISDPENLHIYVNNIDVILGNTDNINQKISTLTEVLKEIDENDKGFLYLDNLDYEIRFQYLT